MDKVYKLNIKHYLPIILMAIFAVSMLALTTLPYSQYKVMQIMQDADVSSRGGLSLAVAGTANIFLIIVSSLTLIGAALCLLAMNLYRLRLFAIADMALMIATASLETVYVIALANKGITDNEGHYIFTAINWIPFILAWVFVAFFIVGYIYLIRKPYIKIANECKEAREDNLAQGIYLRGKRDEYKQELSKIDSKEKMVTYLKEKLDEGKITKEQYDELIKELGYEGNKEE